MTEPQLSYPLLVSPMCQGTVKVTGWIARELRDVPVQIHNHNWDSEPALLFSLTDRVIAEDFRGHVIPRLHEITALRSGGRVTNRGSVGFTDESFASVEQLKEAVLRVHLQFLLDEHPGGADMQALEHVRDLCLHHFTTLDDVNLLQEAFSVRAGCVTHTSHVTEQVRWSKCHAVQWHFRFTPARKWWKFTVARPKFTCEFHNASFHYEN